MFYQIKCPHCGENVLLVKKADGGCFVVDELGYPWTKHQCGGMFYQPAREEQKPKKPHVVLIKHYKAPVSYTWRPFETAFSSSR
jgi:hypothetical protein